MTTQDFLNKKNRPRPFLLKLFLFLKNRIYEWQIDSMQWEYFKYFAKFHAPENLFTNQNLILKKLFDASVQAF